MSMNNIDYFFIQSWYLLLQEQVYELVAEYGNKELEQRLFKLFRHKQLVLECIEHDINFSWDEIIQRGWFCKHDWEVFPEELKDITYEQAHDRHKQWRKQSSTESRGNAKRDFGTKPPNIPSQI